MRLYSLLVDKGPPDPNDRTTEGCQIFCGEDKSAVSIPLLLRLQGGRHDGRGFCPFTIPLKKFQHHLVRAVRPGSINRVAFQGADLRTVGVDVTTCPLRSVGWGGSVAEPSAVKENDRRLVWKA
jgi:hypothetical protein